MWPWVLQKPKYVWYETIRLYSSIFLKKTSCSTSPNLLHARLVVCLREDVTHAWVRDWSGFLTMSGGNNILYCQLRWVKRIRKKVVPWCKLGSSLFLWVVDAQDELSHLLFCVCCSGVLKGLRSTSTFCWLLFFLGVCALLQEMVRVGTVSIEGVKSAQPLMPTVRFIFRSLNIKLGKTTNQPVDHNDAATSCHGCLCDIWKTSHHDQVGQRGGRRWAWDVPAGKHLLRRGVGMLSAHFEPWEMRWNGQEQIVCE